MEQIKDFSGVFYKRPVEKGYVMNWDLQQDIWSRAFSKDILDIKTTDYGLLVTEPFFNPPLLQNTMYEVVFEEYRFQNLFTTSAPQLSMFYYKYEHPDSAFANSSCNLVLDSGYSFTHLVPFYDNYKINYAIKRINLGGKALTNHLKEIVSYRQWNMMEETYLINDVKEQLCYVSQNFKKDLETTKHKKKRKSNL